MSLSSKTSPVSGQDPWIEIIRRKLATMRFGSIQLVVHEGRVTQIESLEKTRIITETQAPKAQDQEPQS